MITSIGVLQVIDPNVTNDIGIARAQFFTDMKLAVKGARWAEGEQKLWRRKINCVRLHS